MTDRAITGTAHINNGPGWPCQLRTETERIDVSTAGPKVDTRWTHTDGAGHYHAYNQRAEGQRDRYPTLVTRTEVVPCAIPEHDEDCDGANITHWHCAICDEELTPGLIPGPHYATTDGPMSWTVKVAVPVDQLSLLVNRRTPVSLRIAYSETGHELFGIAHVSGAFTVTSPDTHATLTLVGGSPLGQRRTA
jgi:hypothetical protein